MSSERRSGKQLPALSVVLPVYAGARAEHLQRALDSVYAQTYPPYELLVVEDGPLTPELWSVLDGYRTCYPPVRRISLPTNRGRGVANQQGLLAANGDWIAKMDADDVCLPTRFERQVQALIADGVDLVGTAMGEFLDREEVVVGVRRMPGTHEEITARIRINNPINHPTVVYRRSLALQVGGYKDMRMEDYDLFARMLKSGARMTNLAEPLVLFRADENMYRRRGSWALIRSEVRLQRNLRRYGLIGWLGVARNLVVRIAFRKLPPPLLRFAYRRLFHDASLESPATNSA